MMDLLDHVGQSGAKRSQTDHDADAILAFISGEQPAGNCSKLPTTTASRVRTFARRQASPRCGCIERSAC